MTGSRVQSWREQPTVPGGPQLRVLLRHDGTGGRAVLRFAGEIDITTADIVTGAVDRCLQDRPSSLTLDLSSVTFCDCAGVRELRRAWQRTVGTAAEADITAPSPQVQRIFALLGADGLLSADPAGRTGAHAPSAGQAAAAGPGDRAEPGGSYLVPPAPPPQAVWAAR